VKSVQSVFERFARTELWYLGGFDFNLSAGTGVATSARCTFAHRKSAKPNQGHSPPFFESDPHGAKSGFQRTTCCGFRQVSLLGNVFDQFSFVHKQPLEWADWNPKVWIPSTGQLHCWIYRSDLIPNLIQPFTNESTGECPKMHFGLDSSLEFKERLWLN
jgi:hypothetical protein